MSTTTKTNENTLSDLLIVICLNSTGINFCVWGCHSLDSFLWNFVICWKVDKAPTTHASPAKCIPPATLVLSSATCCNLEIPSVTCCTSLHQAGGQCNHLVSTVHPSAPTCTRAHKRPGQPQWPVILWLQSVKAKTYACMSVSGLVPIWYM